MGDYAYNCEGKTVTLELAHKDGEIALHTPSGTLSIPQDLITLNSVGIRADLDRTMQTIAYKERGLTISYAGNYKGGIDDSIRKVLREHRTLQKRHRRQYVS